MAPATLLSSSAKQATAVTPVPFLCAWGSLGSGAAWVEPVGELDLATAPQLEEALEAARASARLVVLDLRRLTFLDSTGVHLVIDAGTRARRSGRRLVVIRGTGQVQILFALMNTSQYVEMFDLPSSQPAVQVLVELASIGVAA